MENNFDIAKNIKSIENLKIQLLNRTASLFNAFNEDDMSLELIDDICHIVITGYILGNKLGYDFNELNEEILKRVKAIPADLNEENEYNLKELIAYLRRKRQ